MEKPIDCFKRSLVECGGEVSTPIDVGPAGICLFGNMLLTWSQWEGRESFVEQSATALEDARRDWC